MTQRPTYEAIVHKANVPLMADESLRQFTHELEKAAKPYIAQKFNLDDDASAWPMEVYANKAVFNVIPEWEDVSKDFMLAVKFERDKEGTFTFGETQKVKPVTTYQVTKRAELPRTFGISSVTADVETKKSLWHGVL